MSEKKYDDIKKRVIEGVPEILKNIAIGLLIWLFGVLIFIPLGTGIKVLNTLDVSKAVSTLIIMATGIVFLKAVKQIVEISEYISLLAVSFTFGKTLPIEKETRYAGGFKKLLYLIITLRVLPISTTLQVFAGLLFL